MRAAYFTDKGDRTMRIGDLPDPQPGAGQVRVRLHRSGINPSDVKRWKNWGGARPEPEIVVPNNDGAGFVDAVGPGIDPARIGQRVWVYEASRDGRTGTAAEVTVQPQARVVALPDKADFDFGASLGVPAMTAHRCVFADGPVAGQTLLVAGGAGSVGRFAVQLAKWAGAHVIATAGSEATMAVARQAGADQVLSYSDADLAAKIMAAAGSSPSRRIDRIIEVAPGPNLALDAQVIAPNGIVAIYAFSDDADEQAVAPARLLLTKAVTLRWIMVYSMPEADKSQATADINQAITEGALTPLIARRYPLDRIEDAQEAVGILGAGGKVLLEI
jgi:NADPH2:quinone reductase